MPKLTKQQIIEAKDLPLETVHVPEWGGEVDVRGLSGADRDSFEDETVKFNGGERVVNVINLRARLCARCMVDEKGERMFSEDEVAELGRKSGAALARVFAAAQRLSGLSPEDVKELEKN